MKPHLDEYGKEILVDETGFQVMMEWEKLYMEALVDTLRPSGHVLEVGFGLGYSANKIQTYPIESYTVIENDPEVISRILEWAPNQKCTVHVVEGPWQETLPHLTNFDSIFFDDSPIREFDDPKNSRLYNFYYEILSNHANVGCRFTAYMDHPIYWVSHPFTTWENKIFPVDIPENCNYVPNKEAGFVCMPLITFPYGSIPNPKKISLDSDFQVKVEG
jgi:guanidinoacetate N-methyltransferase